MCNVQVDTVDTNNKFNTYKVWWLVHVGPVWPRPHPIGLIEK